MNFIVDEKSSNDVNRTTENKKKSKKKTSREVHTTELHTDIIITKTQL
jgi:hypothetical protein